MATFWKHGKGCLSFFSKTEKEGETDTFSFLLFRTRPSSLPLCGLTGVAKGGECLRPHSAKGKGGHESTKAVRAPPRDREGEGRQQNPPSSHAPPRQWRSGSPPFPTRSHPQKGKRLPPPHSLPATERGKETFKLIKYRVLRALPLPLSIKEKESLTLPRYLFSILRRGAHLIFLLPCLLYRPKVHEHTHLPSHINTRRIPGSLLSPERGREPGKGWGRRPIEAAAADHKKIHFPFHKQGKDSWEVEEGSGLPSPLHICLSDRATSPCWHLRHAVFRSAWRFPGKEGFPSRRRRRRRRLRSDPPISRSPDCKSGDGIPPFLPACPCASCRERYCEYVSSHIRLPPLFSRETKGRSDRPCSGKKKKGEGESSLFSL